MEAHLVVVHTRVTPRLSESGKSPDNLKTDGSRLIARVAPLSTFTNILRQGTEIGHDYCIKLPGNSRQRLDLIPKTQFL